MLLQGLHLLFQALRLLEVEPPGRLRHERLIVADHFPAPAREDTDDLVDVVAVLLAGVGTHTGSLAPADVEIQARTELFPKDSLGRNRKVAGSQRVHLPEKIHQVAGMHHAAVRTEIPVAASLVDTARNEHFRKFVTRHADPGIRLRILQEDVVLRLVLLDEVVLQQQGIRFGVHDRILGVGDLRDEDPRLCRQPLGRHEILCHPLVQVLRLPHIDDIPRSVIIPVDARGMWK